MLNIINANKWIFDILFFVFKVICIVCLPFLITIIINIVKKYLKGERLKKNDSYFPIRRRNIFVRLFIDFPKQYVNDLFDKNPGEFRDYGLRIIDGRQGSGKTVLQTYLLLKYKKEYPNCKIGTNYGYKGEDFTIDDWRDLLPTKENSNGIYGRILVLDEIHNYFSTASSRDFNPSVLQEISQQRKQHSVIYGTVQTFSRCAKQIREQTYILMQPFTVLGCLTVVREYDISLTDDATIDKKKLKKIWFFVHDKELRDSFDTFKKIEKYKNEGFIPQSLEETNVNLNTTVSLDKKSMKTLKKRV